VPNLGTALLKNCKNFPISATFGQLNSILRKLADCAQNSARAESQNPSIHKQQQPESTILNK